MRTIEDPNEPSGLLVGQPVALIDYSGDDYPRLGCTASVEVRADGYRLRVFTPGGVLIESYAPVQTRRAIARMLEEWCAGSAPRLRCRSDQESESGS